MYVALKDTEGNIAVVKYGDYVGEDITDVKHGRWQQWAIDLDDGSSGQADDPARVWPEATRHPSDAMSERLSMSANPAEAIAWG